MKTRHVVSAERGETRRGWLTKPGLADFLVGHGKASAPLVKWLARHVG